MIANRIRLVVLHIRRWLAFRRSEFIKSKNSCDSAISSVDNTYSGGIIIAKDLARLSIL